MIEFRKSPEKYVITTWHPWRSHAGKHRVSDFFFSGFEYKIFGEIFTSQTPEFEIAFSKYLVWRQLQND